MSGCTFPPPLFKIGIIEKKREELIRGRCALILKFSEAIGLKKKAAEYFENMVLFNEANSHEEKKLYFLP